MTLDANLNADIFRNVILNNIHHSNKNVLHDILEINDDNTVLLCANDKTSRFQNSLLSLYKSPDDLTAQNVFTVLREEVTTSAAAFINNKLIFVAEDSGTVKLCTTDTYDGKHDKLKTVAKNAAHQDVVNSVVKLANSTNCVTAGNDLEIKIWETNYIEDRFTGVHSYYPAHRDFITGLTVNKTEENIFGSCSNDCTSFLWDLRKSTPASGLFKSDYGLKCITWQPDSTVIAFGDCDGTILLVDSRCPGAAFKTIYGFSAEIQNLEFCPTNPKLLAACADDTIVKVINIEKDNPNCTIYEENVHSSLVRSLAWNRDSCTLYSCGYDNKICTHNIETV